MVRFAGDKQSSWESEDRLSDFREAIKKFDQNLRYDKNSTQIRESTDNTKKSGAKNITRDGGNAGASLLPEYLKDYEEGSFAAGDVVDIIDGRHIHQGQAIS